MKTTHTQGPWLAAAKPTSIVGWPVVSPAAMGRSICSVTVHDEAEANARLIAAAPELLEALKLYDAYRALPTDRGGASGAKHQAYAAFIAAKDAAIIKAKGGAA
jgi:hypothetical protein